MSKKNWIAPEGCSYVIDTEAEASESEQKHYGGCVVAESIYHEGDMELILAAPGQAEHIVRLEAALREIKRNSRLSVLDVRFWRAGSIALKALEE